MATEFTILLKDQPGSLADLTETLSKGGLNIVAIHVTPCPSHGIVQFITDNPDATTLVLKNAQIEYTAQQVLLLSMKHEPGALAHLARTMAQASININAVYITIGGQVVLDVDRLSDAQTVAMGLGMR